MPLQLYEKNKILDSCLMVFIKNGYSKTTTAMLAGSAGISKALIFHHFKSKKKLYISILERCFEKMASEVADESPFDFKDFFKAKEKLGMSKVGYLRKNSDISKILFEAFYLTPDELKTDISRFKIYLEQKYEDKKADEENKMFQLFNEIPLRKGVKTEEAYDLIKIVSEYFKMKLAAELTDEKKMQDDSYWKSFFKQKRKYLNMVRYGIEEKSESN